MTKEGSSEYPQIQDPDDRERRALQARLNAMGTPSTDRKRREIPNTVKIGIPMSVLGSLVIISLGWAWNTDKNQALDHQRVEDLRIDMKDVLGKLDNLKDIILRK